VRGGRPLTMEADAASAGGGVCLSPSWWWRETIIASGPSRPKLRVRRAIVAKDRKGCRRTLPTRPAASARRSRTRRTRCYGTFFFEKLTTPPMKEGVNTEEGFSSGEKHRAAHRSGSRGTRQGAAGKDKDVRLMRLSETAANTATSAPNGEPSIPDDNKTEGWLGGGGGSRRSHSAGPLLATSSSRAFYVRPSATRHVYRW
jgi:hypothetical protein